MNTKNLLLIASLFVASSLHAGPLTWRFDGTAASGELPGEGPANSMYNGKLINGAKFTLEIFVDTTLRPDGGCEETVCFSGPFRAQVTIAGVGTVPAYFFRKVAYLSPLTNSPFVVTFDEMQGPIFDDEEFVSFGKKITTSANRLTAIPPTVVSSSPQDYKFDGPGLQLFGKVNTFSALAGAVVAEVPGNGRTPSAPGVVTGVLRSSSGFKIPILEVFVRGNDNAVYVNAFNASADTDSAFSGWRGVEEGGLTNAPPAPVMHNGVLKLFIRGQDNGIWQNTFRGLADQPETGWSGVFPIDGGGTANSGPAAVVYNGTLKLFIRGFDNEIYENDFVNGKFTGWNKLPGGGTTLSTPAAVVHNRALKLFIRGEDDGIYENDFIDGTFGGWHEVPGNGTTFSAPSALVHQGILKLFVKGGFDHAVWENDFNSTSFGDWSKVSSGDQKLTPSAPAAVEAFQHYPTIFLRGEDSRILQGFF